MSTTQTQTARRSKPSAARLLGQFVSYLVLLVVLFAGLVLIAVPLVTGSQTYTVLTSSMAPAYKPGTLIVVKPTPMAELEVGDVITYQLWSGRPEVVTHRIVGFSADQDGEPMVMTKGDNNAVIDPEPVREIQIRGRLLYGVPEVGHLANALGRSDRGRVVQVIAVAAIIYGGIAMGRGLVNGRRDRRDADALANAADATATDAPAEAESTPDAQTDDDAVAESDELYWAGARR